MSARKGILSFARRDRGFLAGGVIAGLAVVLAVIGPYIVPFDPERSTSEIYAPPSATHWFGTDDVGIDVFSRTVAAFRIDVLVAVSAVSISFVIGVLLGAISGFAFSSRLGRAGAWLLPKVADMVQAFPVFVMAFALVGTFGPDVINVILAIAFVCVPAFMRHTRGAVLTAEREAYVDAARVMGQRERRILFRHVLPNSLDAAIANASVSVGVGILLTAGLSFIGAGVRPPTPEWGIIISSGSTSLITGAWWISVLPGLVLVATVCGFALLGDGLRRYLDPSGRQSTLQFQSKEG